MDSNNLNDFFIQQFLKGSAADRVIIGLVHYIFRNGPVEDMHAAGKLSQDDMKTLNKYIVNRLANLSALIQDKRWRELELLLNAYSIYGIDWDHPQPDMESVEEDLCTILNFDAKRDE